MDDVPEEALGSIATELLGDAQEDGGDDAAAVVLVRAGTRCFGEGGECRGGL